MSRVLMLTSPHMRGDDVKHAQTLLAEHLHLTAKDADGEYGPVTASSVAHAKYQLGYAKSQCTPVYGKLLDGYLSGKSNPTPLMRARAAARKRGAQSQTGESVGAKAADTMIRWFQSGWKEYPAGSNVVPPLQQLMRKLGEPAWICAMGQPWCALSSMTAALNNGSTSAKAGLIQQKFNALYCPELKTIATNGQYGMRAVPKTRAQKGTYILFDWNGDGTMDHVGIALGGVGETVSVAGTKYTVPKNSICTVEGNADDAVRINVHDLGVVGFAFTLS